jgi:hypothetical protein
VRDLVYHVGLLGLAAVLAIAVWTKDDEAPKPDVEQVQVWGGSPAGVQKITFEGSNRKVRMEAKQDGQGSYYVTTVDKEEINAPQAHDPHDGHGHDAKPDVPKTPGKKEQLVFIAVKQAEELVKQLAPLKALRAVGKIDDKRAEEFGFDKPEGTLKVTLGGREHALVIGGATPGGVERYAKYLANNEVFAVPGEIAQNLLFAEARLIERELHGFKMEDVTRVQVSKGQKSRELTRVKDKTEGWADPSKPDKLDETAGNWMAKLGRLRVQEYVEKPSKPLKPEEAVVRVDYFEGKKNIGFIELFKLPGEKGNEFLARTEYGRWFVKVLTSNAEQVENDLGSVLK